MILFMDFFTKYYDKDTTRIICVFALPLLLPPVSRSPRWVPSLLSSAAARAHPPPAPLAVLNFSIEAKLLIWGKCRYDVWLIRSQTAFFRPTFVSWPSLSTICCNLPWPCTSSSPSWKFHDDYIPNDSMVKISSAGIFSIAPFLNRTLSWNVNCHFMQYQ